MKGLLEQSKTVLSASALEKVWVRHMMTVRLVAHDALSTSREGGEKSSDDGRVSLGLWIQKLGNITGTQTRTAIRHHAVTICGYHLL